MIQSILVLLLTVGVDSFHAPAFTGRTIQRSFSSSTSLRTAGLAAEAAIATMLPIDDDQLGTVPVAAAAEMPNVKDIRIGVIGCGRIGLVHLSAISKTPGVHCVVCSNPTISKAEAGTNLAQSKAISFLLRFVLTVFSFAQLPSSSVSTASRARLTMLSTLMMSTLSGFARLHSFMRVRSKRLLPKERTSSARNRSPRTSQKRSRRLMHAKRRASSS